MSILKLSYVRWILAMAVFACSFTLSFKFFMSGRCVQKSPDTSIKVVLNNVSTAGEPAVSKTDILGQTTP